MIVSMDLNASPVPEEDEEVFERHEEVYSAPEEHIETGASIARREREERKRRLKRDRSLDRPVHDYHQPARDQFQPAKILKSDRSRLPPGWLDCPAFGQEICCMIPSKVPLGESFNDCITPGKRYSFKQVIHQQRVWGRKLGLVIDLTNSYRYYTTAELNKEGIKYVKIPCKGRDSVPDNKSVNMFVYEVIQFLSRQKHSKKYILVHCTHGHNRTGYMIINYLVRALSISVTQALKMFSDARPPGIYKPDYVDGLYAFYHERKPEVVVCPPTPEWKRSSDLDLNGEAVPDDDDDGGSAAPLNENHDDGAQVLTNDDILGDEIPEDQERALKHFCYQMLKLSAGARANLQFPGSHPVSLNRDNLQLLRQRYYYATWKADGTRYMMLITVDGCYLIDRGFKFRRVQMRFPYRNVNDGLIEKMHHYTLLDGEMVIDTLPDSQKQERRYLIYDVMAINHVSITERPFCERWAMLDKEVTEPRNYDRQHIYQSRNPHYRYDLEPFRVRRKDFWMLSTVPKVLKVLIQRLSHDADGLIFQPKELSEVGGRVLPYPQKVKKSFPVVHNDGKTVITKEPHWGWDDAYVPRTHEGLLKWKYPEMNSVDFLFEVLGEDDSETLILFERGKRKTMDGNRVKFKDGDPSFYSGKIVECSWDSDEQVWVCMRIRTDKTTPNDFNTYRKVMRSIKDNITEDDLLKVIDEIIRLPMYADRIKFESKVAQAAQHMKTESKAAQATQHMNPTRRR